MEELTKETVFPETIKFLKSLDYSEVAKIIAKAIAVTLDRDCASINERLEEVISIISAEKDAIIEKYDKRNILLSKLAGMRRLAEDANKSEETLNYSVLKPLVLNTLKTIYNNDIDYKDLADSLGLKVTTTKNGLNQFKSKRFVLAICALLDINPYIKNESD